MSPLPCLQLFSIHQPLCQPVISIDAPITQEWPVRARDIHFLQVNRHEQVLLIVHTGFGEDLTGSSGDETLAPELDAVAARGTFEADAIGHRDIAAVGDRMAALDEFPRVMLPGAVPFFFARMPADRRGLIQNLRPL